MTLFIGPLKLVFEVIFSIANGKIGHPGFAIIFLSLAMNILVLPLYRRADAMQEKARDTDMKLSRGISHIKKSFSGDEKMMILQTYYRQNDYSPLSSLTGSVSLLLEIPFFMAAYQFLSGLDVLNGVSFGPIKDLSSPDGLIVIGSLTLNLLPILMTLVNCISSAIYLKGFPLKTKIQLYAMAAFFLVFLYTSPSGLVFYWTLNNIFSLVKTVFYKLKNPRFVLNILTSVLGLTLLASTFVDYSVGTPRMKLFTAVVGIALIAPGVLSLVKKKLPAKEKEYKPNKAVFVIGSLFLAIFTGLFIPSSYLAASPQEYVSISSFFNPVWYAVSAFCMSAGAFLIWMRVFYWLADSKGKVYFEKGVWVLCGVFFANYMFFGRNLGIISPSLKYEGGFAFSPSEQLINIAVICVIGAVFLFVIWKWKKVAVPALLTASIAIGTMSGINLVTVNSSVSSLKPDKNGELSPENKTPEFTLSKNNKNVVLIMLDRAMGVYMPFLLNEKPELREKLDGFTYYDNVISFGGYTNFCTPSLFGGYEYTPVEMNRRSDEAMVDKHNEALKMLPVLFSENGYKTTVSDPPYAGYEWIPDLSIYGDYPEIDAYISKGKFGNEFTGELFDADNRMRNFFCFGFMKSMPLFAQKTLYGHGGYNQATSVEEFNQTRTGISQSTGVTREFLDPYSVLTSLPSITKITDTDSGTFMSFVNDTTHEPMLLQTPDYVPSRNVDNSEYDSTHTNRFKNGDSTLICDTDLQMIHYHANMASLLRLSEWFDYLRENGVYDNTRIIIVSDHGRYYGHLKELDNREGVDEDDIEMYFPLFLVKDFGAKGFNVSHEFMTNADVPTIATDGVIENPVNPFTGKALNNDEKTAHEQYIIRSHLWEVEDQNPTTFAPSTWVSVKDDIWDRDNWTYYSDYTVLSENSLGK